jgi:Resolvase, N terminal domain
LIDEFQRAGGEVISLNHQLGRTAEDDLLLQVQGMVAEDERAKMLERSRRGKRHAAHCGAASVLSAAPYGYRNINKQDGSGQRVFDYRQGRTDALDSAVCQQECALLEQPVRLEQQYRRRLQPQPDSKDGGHALLEGQLGKLRQGLARLIDSYAEGLLDEGEFEPRITPLRDRTRKLEQQIQRLMEEASLERGTSTSVASCRVGGKGEFRSPCRNVLETR